MGGFIIGTPPPCDPNFDPTCPGSDWPGGVDGGPIVYPPIVVPVEVPTVAGVDSMAAALTNLISGVGQVVSSILAALVKFLAGVLALWGIVKGVLDAVARLIAKVLRIFDKILKPLFDAMRRYRQAILDIYNRYVRPIIVLIERVRRVIHILQLLHIHVFDALDRKLARIEYRIMRPLLDALYRVNTLGNWVSFILNVRLLLRRGLLLGSVQQNKGGAFSLVAGAPAYGFTELAHVDTAGAAAPPISGSQFVSTVGAAFTDAAAATDPSGDLAKCWRDSLASFELGAGDPLGDLWRCLNASVK